MADTITYDAMTTNIPMTAPITIFFLFPSGLRRVCGDIVIAAKDEEDQRDNPDKTEHKVVRDAKGIFRCFDARI